MRPTHTAVLLSLLLTASLAGCYSPVPSVSTAPEPGARSAMLVPVPSSVTAQTGEFRLTAQTRILAPEALSPVAHMLADYLRPATGRQLPKTPLS